jgi:L-alanine-DL-glutamate epimerase-like enolase superfamily enzyme
MQHVIRDVFTRHMAGENPENIELMFRRAYSSGFTQRPDLTVMGAFSGLEIACWDILGKDRDRPVYALIGGLMNGRIRAYSYLYPLPHHDMATFWTSPEHHAEAAADLVARGFTAVKFDPAGPYTLRGGHMPAMTDITTSVAICAAIRAAVGDRADLLFGTHGQFATGERLTTKAEFAAVLRAGAATILQPALGRAGGIWEMKKVAALAEVCNVQMAPHLYAGPVEWAANIHLAASIPNILMLETIETPFHSALIKSSITVENGFVTPPTAPGLGIDVDEALARAHPYDGKGLHLEMQEAACDYCAPNAFSGGAPPR